MQHVTVKASVAEATDTGTFTAIAAAWSTDRTNERIIRGAFADTIRRWRSSGKDVPLAWDHGRSASEIIGSIDPNSMAERNSGLFVAGKLDIEDSELAREAWRSVKRNRISLSFGYKVDRSRKATDGVQELTSLDLYEITLTTVPANADTRVLSAKSMRPRRYLDRDNNLVSYDELLAGLGSRQQPGVIRRTPCGAEVTRSGREGGEAGSGGGVRCLNIAFGFRPGRPGK